MKPRFHALTILSTIFKVLGVLNALFMVGGGFVAMMASGLSDKGVGPGIMVMLMALVVGATSLFFYWIVAEMIALMLSIERNTHEAAELLKRR